MRSDGFARLSVRAFTGLQLAWTAAFLLLKVLCHYWRRRLAWLNPGPLAGS